MNKIIINGPPCKQVQQIYDPSSWLGHYKHLQMHNVICWVV